MKKKLSLIMLPLLLAVLVCTVLIVSASSEPAVHIGKVNLSFEDNVYILYGVELTGTDDASGLGLLVWDAPQQSYVKGSETACLASAGKTEIEGEWYYVFEYTALSAKQMTDDVYARAFVTVGDQTYYSDVEKYSILQYAYNKLGKTDTATEDETLKTLLTDMLAYGASAQKHFGYKTDRLATSAFYQVKVVDGTLPDGFEKGLYQKGESVTLTADATKNGEAFSYWELLGTSAGETPTLSVTVGEANAVYTAVYGASAPAQNPLVAGTLLFQEDFEDLALSDDQAAILEKLGWSYLAGKPTLSVVEHGGSKHLAITGVADGASSDDMYLQFLASDQFTYLSDQNYTYQFDLYYNAAPFGDTSQYVNVISNYNGSEYDSVHLRYAGGLNNEHYTGSSWKKYCSTTSASTVLSALFSAKPSNLNGYSLSLRCVIDWENGNKIYVRVNGGAAGTTGDWVLIAQYNASQATITPNPAAGGGAMALKARVGANAYVDNIMVWSGTTEAPTTDEPYVTPETTCHKYFINDGTETCAICGRTAEQIENAWVLDAPRYDSVKVPSLNAYLGGQGLDPDQPLEKENKMQIIPGSNPEEFAAYRAKLVSAGYTLEFENSGDGNLFASYVLGTKRVYTYYIAATGEARVITERTDVSASVADFGYTYTPKMGEGTTLYQYALPMRDDTHTSGQGYVDRGMLYVIKLADGSLILVDGGEACQFPDTQVENFMAFLREITGTGETDTIKVAAWHLTHAHADHMQGLFRVFTKYHQYFDLERVFYNLPSYNIDNDITTSTGGAVSSTNENVEKMLGYLNTYFADDMPEYLKIHTGHEFDLADVHIEVMYTHEDLVAPDTGLLETTDNYNEVSAVLKFTIAGKTFLLLGDVDIKGATILMENWSDESLKVDMMQVAHHVLNDLTDLYHITQASVLVVPQSLDRIEELIAKGDKRAAGWPAAEQYAADGMIFFQNENTVGLSITEEGIEVVYLLPVLYDNVKNQSW